jgi:hypothetical protein
MNFEYKMVEMIKSKEQIEKKIEESECCQRDRLGINNMHFRREQEEERSREIIILFLLNVLTTVAPFFHS